MNQSKRRVTEFLDDLASRSATPGGGSASALVGAVAAALCAMVGRLNDKKDGTAGPLHETIAAADALRKRLESLIDEDIAAFESLAASWKLPDDAANAAAKQAAIVRATRSPIEIMDASLEVMHLAAAGIEKSKSNCLSDAGVAGLCAHAALESARLNVMINLPGITDGAERAALRTRADALRNTAARLRESIEGAILRHYG